MTDAAGAGASTYAVTRPPSAHPDPDSDRPGLRALWALSKAGDEQLQTLVDLVHDLCDVPLAALAIFEGEDYHLNITAGIEPLTCNAEDTLCVQVMDTRDTVHVEDVRADARFASSPYVDGRFLTIGFYASAPVYDPDGVMVGRLCVFDLEPRRLTETQLRALGAVAQDFTHIIELHLRREADRAIRSESVADELLRVAAQMGHDMRTPLTAVLTALEMLAETEPDADPARRRIINSAHRSTRRLTGIVEGILRLHAVARDVELVPVDLAQTVDHVLRDSALLLQARSATVEVGDLPVVLGDADQLYSVLANLVSNAVKYTHPGIAPAVRISSHPTADGWRIEVSDNGIGIPEESRAEVFEMGTRLAGVTQGDGIGLATVARVVQAHGGRAGVDESPTGGATVWFELPARA